jgi:hypothetical protein
MAPHPITVGERWRYLGPETGSGHYTIGHEYAVLSPGDGFFFYIEDNNGASANGGHGHAWADDDEFRKKFEPVALPVRTVTRLEIVPGTYGAVQITNVYPDGVNIYANSGKWSAPDLRAAARVFNSLAEALEESP